MRALYANTCQCPGDSFDPCYCPEKLVNDPAVIADLISQCDNYDADENGGYLTLKTAVECPECGEENKSFRDHGNPWEGSIYHCVGCDIELGRQYPVKAK